MKPSSVAALFAVGVVVAACGSNGNAATSSNPLHASGPVATASAPEGPRDVTVKDFKFTPAALTVKVGTTVTFANQDGQAHTATADDGSFDAGSIAAGADAAHTFDRAGTFAYHCSFHPFMKATISVAS